MGNDDSPGVSGVDFGVVASDFVDTTTTGTTDYRVVDLSGSLALFEFAAPVTTLTNVIPFTNDGFDMTFFANSVPVPVPLPAGALLVLTGLGALYAARRRPAARL